MNATDHMHLPISRKDLASKGLGGICWVTKTANRMVSLALGMLEFLAKLAFVTHLLDFSHSYPDFTFKRKKDGDKSFNGDQTDMGKVPCNTGSV